MNTRSTRTWSASNAACGRAFHGAEAERIRSYIRENRGHTIIANLEVRLVTRLRFTTKRSAPSR
jgi:hypothetical protein